MYFAVQYKHIGVDILDEVCLLRGTNGSLNLVEDMRWPVLFLVIVFVCTNMELLHSLVLYGLCLHPIYGVYFGPLSVSYRGTRVFDSGWIEYFCGQGVYWVIY